MSKLVRLLLALLAAPALAQEPAQPTIWEYLRAHTSVVSGVASANGERSEFVSLALDDSFEIKPRLIGFGGLSLFGRQRVQGIAGSARTGDPQIPTSYDDLALYSAGEVTAGAYFEATPKLGIECRGAITFQMTGITGPVGEPVDASKVTLGCGPRLTGSVGTLSVVFGHSGPVDEGAHLLGFLPSTVVNGAFRLTDSTQFLLHIAAGRDLATNKAVTSTRFAVRKAFR